MTRAAALALTVTLLGVAPARAQEGSVTQQPAALPAAPPPERDAVPLDEYTARMIGARKLKLGVLAFEYAPTDWLSFGTDPPVWAVRAVASVLVPNLHVKGAFLQTPRVIVSGVIAGYYANVHAPAAEGQLLTVPLSLFVSVKLATKVWLHLEGNYNWARGFGSPDLTKADIGGVAVMRTAQVGAMLELKLSRVVALIARGRYQAYSSPIVLEGNGMLDPYTQADVSIQAQSLHPHAAMGVGGVALTWKYVGVVAGAGYGQYFVPGANLALAYTGVVPEASLWALF